MWEWRVFYPTRAFDIWAIIRPGAEDLLRRTQADTRPDFYFDVRNPKFGLKERWEAHRLKLELKVRTSRDEETQAESWEKVLSIPIREVVDQETGISWEIVKSLVQAAANSQAQNHILKDAAAIQQLGWAERIGLQKDRKQVKARHREEIGGRTYLHADDPPKLTQDSQQLLIEQTDILVPHLPSGKEAAFRSICVEGPHLDLMGTFLQDTQMPATGKVMGYPEFVMGLH